MRRIVQKFGPSVHVLHALKVHTFGLLPAQRRARLSKISRAWATATIAGGRAWEGTPGSGARKRRIAKNRSAQRLEKFEGAAPSKRLVVNSTGDLSLPR